jgi:hypothetical protein
VTSTQVQPCGRHTRPVRMAQSELWPSVLFSLPQYTRFQKSFARGRLTRLSILRRAVAVARCRRALVSAFVPPKSTRTNRPHPRLASFSWRNHRSATTRYCDLRWTGWLRWRLLYSVTLFIGFYKNVIGITCNLTGARFYKNATRATYSLRV